MEKDPLNEVFSFVERSYFRLQAGDLLNRCLEEGTIRPIQQMVEQLILAGPQSLDALREIFGQAEQRIAQVQEDRFQLHRDIEKSLSSYGLKFEGLRVEAVLTLNRARFLQILNEQQIDKTLHPACLQILKDSRDLIRNFISRLTLLEEIKTYIQDWAWGIAVESARQDEAKKGPSAALH